MTDLHPEDWVTKKLRYLFVTAFSMARHSTSPVASNEISLPRTVKPENPKTNRTTTDDISTDFTNIIADLACIWGVVGVHMCSVSRPEPRFWSAPHSPPATAGERKLGFVKWAYAISCPFYLHLVSRKHGAVKKQKSTPFFRKCNAVNYHRFRDFQCPWPLFFGTRTRWKPGGQTRRRRAAKPQPKERGHPRRLVLGLGQRRQQQRRQNTDDRDDHQHFNQCERTLLWRRFHAEQLLPRTTRNTRNQTSDRSASPLSRGSNISG